jgi:3-methyladenine DNA glycosylase/8-oxoguanine DNA glycosylase
MPRRAGKDGLMRRRGAILERLIHHGADPVLVRAVQSGGEVIIGARSPSRAGAEYGIERMRFVLGVDDDLTPFLREFAGDGLIGRSLRRRPWLRPGRRPDPFEALAMAVCQQLIEYDRAAAIERRIVAVLGRRWQEGCDLRDFPDALAVTGATPALLRSLDLSETRALTLLRAAREVADGRVDLFGSHEDSWRRLRRVPGIGSWTVEMLALTGQGRFDQVPAGDLGLIKIVGRHLAAGDPDARASEQQVRELFAPYGQWAALAAEHMLAP